MLSNCFSCRKAYVKTYGLGALCSECTRLEQKNLLRIQRFIAEHPGTSIDAVSTGTGVTKTLVIRFLKEGKIQLGSASRNEQPGQVKCSYCAQQVAASGSKLNYLYRYGKVICRSCQEKLAGNLKGASYDPGVSSRPGTGFGGRKSSRERHYGLKRQANRP